MDRQNVVQWLIWVTALLVMLGLAATEAGNHRADTSQTNCGACERTSPTIATIPVNLEGRPKGLLPSRETGPVGHKESAHDENAGAPMPDCLEYGSVMRKAPFGPSLTR